MLQPNTIKSAHGAKHSVKRVGRGNASGHGTSATRGGKGQTARSGGSRGLARLGFRRIMQSTPKLRGFQSLNTKPVEVYLSDIEKMFVAGSSVTITTLKEKNLLGTNDISAKIIADKGVLTKKIFVEGVLTTKSVAEMIKTLGGEIK